TTIHADLADYIIEVGAWAGIVQVFCHLPQPLRARVHRAVAAGLRPGGVAVIEAYTPEQLALGTGGPPLRELLYEQDAIEVELAAGAEIDFEISRECRRHLSEGRRHVGESALLEICARRRVEARVAGAGLIS
ncbi:MAG: hypothetical protein ACYTF0_00425, partial [Planctomycetota bacterium]